MIHESQQFSKDLKIQKLNYKEGLKVDSALIDQHLQALKEVRLSNLETEEEKMAFWINAYNGLTNYLIIKKRIKKSMMAQPQIFFIPKIHIGTHTFSLDDIEHGILRKNTRHRVKLIKQFPFWDIRKNLVVEELDYRIHFALNCGAQSCPPIAFYSADHLENELAMAEANFAEQEFEINNEEKTITCSKLFVWYKRDFENAYLNDPKLADYKVIEKAYDWSI